MKKILFSMAAAALLLNVTSCQNEDIVLQQQEETTSQEFTLQATYGKGTRTTLESNGTGGYATKWSAGDQIFVTDGNGLVTGVLTLTEGEGESTGSFSGIVTGNPAALKYAIFPVPADGVIDLNQVDAGQADAPMTAEINGNQANFQNACGLVRLALHNLPDNAKVTLSAKGIAGTLVADGGSLVQDESADEITIMNAKSGKEFFVPVNASEQIVSTEFTLTIGKLTTKFTANIKKGAVSVKDISEYYVTDGEIFEKQTPIVSSTDELNNALKNANPGAEIILSDKVEDFGTITVGELKDVTIVGNKTSVMIFKTTAGTKIENVKLQNVNFKYTGATADCGIVVNANAQIDNLVVEGCTFTGTGAKAGRGISGLNSNATIVLKECTFKDLGYPIYAWGSYESLTVEGCTFDGVVSWAIMPQSGFDGDLTVTGCIFKDCKGGLVKAGTLTAGHTFTFTNNTVTNSVEHPNRNWFEFKTSAGISVISGNKMDGQPWTPSAADGLK